ncbi:MAG TPA: GDSL-type esterase/lipase family protein [Streptosporangiaceae bacterium]|nr:GDSL-type esterase/lipase family protein [Streptosporangiaceae bacterium]
MAQVKEPPAAFAAAVAPAGPSAAKPVLHELIMGDSYSAGNGAGHYYGPLGCFRSHQDYGERFAAAVRAAPHRQPVMVTDVACSGAVTTDFFHSNHGRAPEIDAVTKADQLVFLTISGNDAHFPDIVKFCLIAKSRDGANCNSNLRRAEKLAASGAVKRAITNILKAIRQRANPAVRIVLLGYPFLEGDQSYKIRSGHGGPFIAVGKRLHALGVESDRIDRSVVSAMNSQFPGHFAFVSVQKLFDGPPYHGLYAQKNNPHRWMIQPFVDASLATFHTWYHPNPNGWTHEASLLLSDQSVPKEIPPLITTTSLPDATKGVPYSAALTTADHRAGSWAITSGTLPAGLHLAGFKISGTPTTLGSRTFTVKFTDRAGQVAIAKANIGVFAKPAPLTWGQPAQLHGTGFDDITGISCATNSFCAAVDSTGHALTGSGLTWSAPASVDPNRLNSVSCPLATFCVAVDNNGDYTRFNGTSWSKPQQVSATGALVSVSCASASFCVAAEADDSVYQYNGSTWSGPSSILPDGDLSAVSCASANFCVAVGAVPSGGSFAGAAVALRSGSWGTPDTIDAQNSLSSVSCVSATFCMTTDVLTQSYRFNGTTWTNNGIINNQASSLAVVPVACASAELCVEGDYGGSGSVFNGSSWSRLTWVEDRVAAAACAAGGDCVLADHGGNVATFHGSWSTPVTVDGSIVRANAVSCADSAYCAVATGSGSGDGGFTVLRHGSWQVSQTGVFTIEPFTVSCPAETFCAAATVGQFFGFGGYPMESDGTTWSRPQGVSGAEFGGGASSVSCPVTGFCLGVGDSSDGAIEYQGSWGLQLPNDGFTGNDEPFSVSCASRTFCLAVGNQLAFTFNGTKWSAGVTVGSNSTFLSRVSCASQSFCVAASQDTVFIYSAGRWTAGTVIDPGQDIDDVSCAASNFCLAVDGGGNAIFFDGQGWSAPVAIAAGDSLNGVSCPTTHFCMAVTQTGQAVTGSS